MGRLDSKTEETGRDGAGSRDTSVFVVVGSKVRPDPSIGDAASVVVMPTHSNNFS